MFKIYMFYIIKLFIFSIALSIVHIECVLTFGAYDGMTQIYSKLSYHQLLKFLPRN